MCKSKVQAFVALVSRSGKIMFLLLFAHGIPLLIATSAVNIVSIMIPKKECRNKILPVNHDIEDLAEDKGTDVPTDKTDKNLVAGKVEGSNKSSLAP